MVDWFAAGEAHMTIDYQSASGGEPLSKKYARALRSEWLREDRARTGFLLKPRLFRVLNRLGDEHGIAGWGSADDWHDEFNTVFPSDNQLVSFRDFGLYAENGELPGGDLLGEAFSRDSDSFDQYLERCQQHLVCDLRLNLSDADAEHRSELYLNAWREHDRDGSGTVRGRQRVSGLFAACQLVDAGTSTPHADHTPITADHITLRQFCLSASTGILLPPVTTQSSRLKEHLAAQVAELYQRKDDLTTLCQQRSCTAVSSGISHSKSGLAAMQVFYINLASRPDRRSRMEHLFNVHDIKNAIRVEASTPQTPRVQQWLEEHPEASNVSAAWVASAASHSACWHQIAALPEGSIGLVLEDDVLFHQCWRTLLPKALDQCQGWELFMLDRWHMDGWDFSAGSSLRVAGVYPAVKCAFADSYCITPVAARWLIDRQTTRDLWNHESVLMDLQQRGHAFTATPKLALQIWGETVSDVQPSGRVLAFKNFYEDVYHKHWGRDLYDSA